MYWWKLGQGDTGTVFQKPLTTASPGLGATTTFKSLPGSSNSSRIASCNRGLAQNPPTM